MVAPEQEKILGVFNFVGEKKADCFKRLLAAIHVIPQKEIVGLGGESPVFEQAEKIRVLTVNVP